MSSSYLKPSRNRSLWWITANRVEHISKRSLDKESDLKVGSKGFGKFLILEHRKDVDQAWDRIKEATENGKLSFSSKVSTRKGKLSWKVTQPSAEDDFELKHVICVYTDGSEADKERVNSALYHLGFIRQLPYISGAAKNGRFPTAEPKKPKTGACLNISKCGGNSLQITQLYPNIVPPPTLFFSKEMFNSIADAIYKAGRTLPPPFADKEKYNFHEEPHLKIYGQRLDNFQGQFCFIIEVGKNRVEFLQEEAMFCYNRFLWFKRKHLLVCENFESDDEYDLTPSREYGGFLPLSENDCNAEAVRGYIRAGR